MKTLTVLYDDACPFCVRCRLWLEARSADVPLAFLPARSPEAKADYGSIPWLGAELVVVGDEGQVWAGPAAFLVSLWALPSYRGLAALLASEALAPLSRRIFALVSSERGRLSALFGEPCREGHCGAAPRRANVYR